MERCASAKASVLQKFKAPVKVLLICQAGSGSREAQLVGWGKLLVKDLVGGWDQSRQAAQFVWKTVRPAVVTCVMPVHLRLHPIALLTIPCTRTPTP
jgi:hypothetical protein